MWALVGIFNFPFLIFPDRNHNSNKLCPVQIIYVYTCRSFYYMYNIASFSVASCFGRLYKEIILLSITHIPRIISSFGYIYICTYSLNMYLCTQCSYLQTSSIIINSHYLSHTILRPTFLNTWDYQQNPTSNIGKRKRKKLSKISVRKNLITTKHQELPVVIWWVDWICWNFVQGIYRYYVIWQHILMLVTWYHGGNDKSAITFCWTY
jgi:hypothetical protein